MFKYVHTPQFTQVGICVTFQIWKDNKQCFSEIALYKRLTGGFHIWTMLAIKQMKFRIDLKFNLYAYSNKNDLKTQSVLYMVFVQQIAKLCSGLKLAKHGSKFGWFSRAHQMLIQVRASWLYTSQSTDRLAHNLLFGFFPKQSVPRATARNLDHCILPTGKAPSRQNTIAQRGRFPHPHTRCTFLFCSTCWLNKTKKWIYCLS